MTNLPVARVIRGDVVHELLPPPRKVPLRLVWRLWFGSTAALFGWAFAAFGMVFTMVFLPQIQLRSIPYDRTATATVTAVEDTSVRENDHRVFKVLYSFVDERGTAHESASYTDKPPTVGARHEVEYFSPEPSKSRLAGMRTKPAPFWVILVLLFPIIGLGLALGQIPIGRRAVHLLRYGDVTKGTLLRSRETGTHANKKPEIEMTFRYEVNGRTYTVDIRTFTPAALTDDAEEPMLYDVRNPACATTLDHLPGAPTITTSGELAAKPGFGVHVLVLPAITVALIVATIVLMAWS